MSCRGSLRHEPWVRRLVQRAQAGDEEAREQLAAAAAPLIGARVRRLRHGETLDDEDLRGAAYVGLFDAVARFDAARGRFITYATWFIDAEIRAVCASRLIRLPTRRARALKRLQEAADELALTLQRPPTPEELAGRLGLTPQQVVDLAAYPADAACEELDEEPAAPEPCESPALLVAEARPRLEGALADLPLRTRLIVEQRFGWGRHEPLTLAQVGANFGLTRERVRQLEAEGLGALRERVTAPGQPPLLADPPDE